MAAAFFNNNLKESNNKLKQSLKELYMNDINMIKLEKDQRRKYFLDEERSANENLIKNLEKERINKLNMEKRKRDDFFKDYHNMLSQSLDNQLIHKSRTNEYSINMYKPNELIYNSSNNKNEKNYVTNTNENNNPSKGYYVASPYRNGNVNQIYSIHNINSDIYKPDNFFTDNIASRKEIISKKRTYPHLGRETDSPKNEDEIKYCNYQNSNPNVFSDNYMKELKTEKLLKQLNLKQSLDFQLKNKQYLLNNNPNYDKELKIPLDPSKFLK